MGDATVPVLLVGDGLSGPCNGSSQCSLFIIECVAKSECCIGCCGSGD